MQAKSEEEKKSWQSSILTCMLNGYNKKLSERIRNKINNMSSVVSTNPAATSSSSSSPSSPSVSSASASNSTTNEIDSSSSTINNNNNLFQNRSAHDIIREKIANFRRLAEFRHSLRVRLFDLIILENANF